MKVVCKPMKFFALAGLLLLAACYDQSTAESFKSRWNHLRRRLGFRTWAASRSFALGCTVTVAVIVLVATLIAKGASLLTEVQTGRFDVAAGDFTLDADGGHVGRDHKRLRLDNGDLLLRGNLDLGSQFSLGGGNE